MRTKRFWFSLVAVVMLICVGCSTPEEKKAKHYKKGMELVKENKLDEAIIEFKNALQIDPKYVDGHHQLGIAYLKKGNLRGAFGELSRTVELNPELYDAQIKLGNLYMLGRKLLEAKEKAALVLKKAPDNIDALYLSGNTLLAEGKPDETIATLNKIRVMTRTEEIF